MLKNAEVSQLRLALEEAWTYYGTVLINGFGAGHPAYGTIDYAWTDARMQMGFYLNRTGGPANYITGNTLIFMLMAGRTSPGLVTG